MRIVEKRLSGASDVCTAITEVPGADMLVGSRAGKDLSKRWCRSMSDALFS